MAILFFFVGLLVLSESQYLETYADSTCSMAAVSGSDGKLGVCQDSKIAVCVGSVLYVSIYDNAGCTGTATNVTLSQGVCMAGLSGGYKGYCSGSTSAPSGAIALKQFNSGQCSGSSLTAWFSLNTCVPDGPTQLSSSMYTKGQGGYIQTSYSLGSCSGQATTSFIPSSYSFSTYYSATSATFSNMAFVVQYANLQCTGSPWSGQAMPANLIGQCDESSGSIFSCSNGVASVTSYDNYNCTGNPQTHNFTTTSGCNNGVQATCAGTLTISGPFVAGGSYSSNGCQGSIQNIQQWYVLNSCIVSGLSSSFQITYSTSANYVNQEIYMTPNCTGVSTTTPLIQTESITWTSSSVLTAVVSKFITATTILILSSYLFA